MELITQRLLLRQWQDKDLPELARLNADPLVMKFYPNTLSTQKSNAIAEKLKALISDRGWGFWAVETLDDNIFIGFVGLHEPVYELPVNPCIEIGWRLAREHWGNGYATEAASASIKFGFEKLDLSEIYSFTSVANIKSRKVMERLKMTDQKMNFKHPMIPEGSPLREHVLYKLNRDNWMENYKTIA